MSINEMTRDQVIETIRIAHQLEHLLDEPIPLPEILRQLSERVDDLTRWIPVEERLPEKGDAFSDYVLTIRFSDIQLHHWEDVTRKGGFTYWRRIDKPEGV